jgi:hypothetical protein
MQKENVTMYITCTSSLLIGNLFQILPTDGRPSIKPLREHASVPVGSETFAVNFPSIPEI